MEEMGLLSVLEVAEQSPSPLHGRMWHQSHPTVQAAISRAQLPPQASTWSLIVSLLENQGVMGVLLLSFCLPQSRGRFQPPRPKITTHELPTSFVKKSDGFSLPVIGLESEHSLGEFFLDPQRLQVRVLLFPRPSSLGDFPCGRRVSATAGVASSHSHRHRVPFRCSTSSSRFSTKIVF